MGLLFEAVFEHDMVSFATILKGLKELNSVHYNKDSPFNNRMKLSNIKVLCINICWATREVLKPEPERRWCQTSRGAKEVFMH